MAKYTLSDIFEGNYRVSQYFGSNPSYYKKFGFVGHEGVDWATPTGTKLLVPFAKGQVLRSAWDPAYGYYTVIWDPVQRCAVWYCHCSKLSVSPSQVLNRFAVVALSGNTGNSTGPHLHCGFVETDAYARRINLNNGYKGFLNIRDKNLVAWKLSR